MPGSLSKTPMRMDTCGPSGQVPPKRLEPQTEQKALTAPWPFPKTRMSSVPLRSRNCSRRTRVCVRPNEPECFRQREQWQWPAQDEWGIDFEANATAEATSADHRGHDRLRSRRGRLTFVSPVAVKLRFPSPSRTVPRAPRCSIALVEATPPGRCERWLPALSRRAAPGLATRAHKKSSAPKAAVRSG